MLNLILIFGMVLNLAVGYFFLRTWRTLAWGTGDTGKGEFRDAASLEWDNDHLYQVKKQDQG